MEAMPAAGNFTDIVLVPFAATGACVLTKVHVLVYACRQGVEAFIHTACPTIVFTKKNRKNRSTAILNII